MWPRFQQNGVNVAKVPVESGQCGQCGQFGQFGQGEEQPDKEKAPAVSHFRPVKITVTLDGMRVAADTKVLPETLTTLGKQ